MRLFSLCAVTHFLFQSRRRILSSFSLSLHMHVDEPFYYVTYHKDPSPWHQGATSPSIITMHYDDDDDGDLLSQTLPSLTRVYGLTPDRKHLILIRIDPESWIRCTDDWHRPHPPAQHPAAQHPAARQSHHCFLQAGQRSSPGGGSRMALEDLHRPLSKMFRLLFWLGFERR